MQEQRIVRAGQLIEQNRLSEAEKELKLALADSPEDSEALAMLAICRSNLQKYGEAVELIRKALSYASDNPQYLYFYSNILLAKGDLTEAEKVIRNAISIYPVVGDFYATLARIYLVRKEWQLALEAAEKGLSVEPENLSCLNSRSTALVKLDKKDEAYETIREALHHDPENAYTHANLGWGLLEKQEPQKALEHFRKALQINPEMEMAKAGLVEGLKARYFAYRLFLRYAFWIGNMKSTMQWGIIIGFLILNRVLNSVATSNPALEPFITPIIILYLLFAFSTWVIGPLSNLFLRINVYGKHALTKDEITSSNYVGISCLVAFVSGIGFLTTGLPAFGTAGLVALGIMIPLSSSFAIEAGRKRNIMLAYTFLVGLIGLFSVYVAGIAGIVYPGAMTFFMLGIFAYQFIANYFLMKSYR